MNHYLLRAVRPKTDGDADDGRDCWQTIGVGTEQLDGNIAIRMNAVPVNFDGRLKLQLAEEAPKRRKGVRR